MKTVRAATWLRTAAVLLLALLLGCNLYVIAARLLGQKAPTLLGFSAAVVISGSMEPAISVDDLILTRAQSVYELGDIITFRSGDSLTTHRIVAVTEEGYQTRGDANNAPDPELVAPENVVGKVVARLPLAGKIIAFVKTPPGMTALVFGGLVLLELPLLLRLWQESADREEPKDET